MNRTMKLKSPLALAAAIFTTVMAAPAWALTVVPPAYAGVEGYVGNNASAAPAMLFEQDRTSETQYAAAQLTGIGVGSQITGLYWRMNGGGTTGPSAAMNFSDFEITLAQAANTITNMSGTFANNLLNPVLVRDGALTISQNSFPGGATPNAFGPFIQFQTPYTYLGGDLVMLVSHTGEPTISVTVDGLTQTTPGYGQDNTFRAIQASSFHATSGNTLEPVPITAFETVPEPGSVLLLGTGLAGLMAWRWKKLSGKRVQETKL